MWDFVVVLAVLYSSIVVPYVSAFAAEVRFGDVWLGFELLSDSIFVADMLVTLKTVPVDYEPKPCQSLKCAKVQFVKKNAHRVVCTSVAQAGMESVTHQVPCNSDDDSGTAMGHLCLPHRAPPHSLIT